MADVKISDVTPEVTSVAFTHLVEVESSGGVSGHASVRNILRSIATVNKTSNFTVSSTEALGSTLTNVGASGLITGTLTAATVGRVVTIARIANHQVDIDPSGSETINGGGAGKKIYLLGQGEVTLRCYVAGDWVIAKATAPWNYEP